PFLAAVHAVQAPEHAPSQQTPSTQKLLVHSFELPHAAPIALSGTQLVAGSSQKYEPTHWASFPQLVPHCVPTQTYGEHGVLFGLHVPMPLHCGFVPVPLLQAGVPHETPDTYSR